MATGQVGELSVALHFDGKQLKGDMASIQGQMSKAGDASGRSFASKWTVAAGNLIAKGVSKLMGTITSTMDSAISRADTLNNFSNVMSNLDVSAEKSQASIEKISEKLSGLPTALDAGAMAVQRFTSANGEVEKSTDMFLALNNALLAGGASTDIQATALEQLSQAYAKGKPDMMEWRTAMTAMPAQLKQVAEAMGYVDATALGEDLRNGKISMDDFMATIVELNTSGVNGFKSFEEQARNATGGIRTQLTNLQTSITKLVTDALNGNDMTKSANQFVERFVEIAPKLIKGFSNAILGLAYVIPDLIPPMVDMVVEMAPDLFNGILKLIEKIVNMLPTLLPKIVQAVLSIAKMLTSPQNLTALFKAWITLFLTVVKAIPQIIVALVDALPQIIDNVISFLTNPETLGMLIGAAVELWMSLALAVPQILGALFGAFGTLLGNLWEGIKTMFGAFAANFGSFITGIFKNAINGVLTFIENFINGPIDILNGFIDVINEAFGGIGVNLGRISRINLPRLAQGGIATGATTAIIGEAGREAVLPLEHNTGNWSGLLASALATEFDERGGSPTGGVVIEKMEFKINNELDAREIGRVMMESIRRAA